MTQENTIATTLSEEEKLRLPGFKHGLFFFALTLLVQILLALPIGGLQTLFPGLQSWFVFINYTLTFGISFFIAKKIFYVNKVNFKDTGFYLMVLLLPLTLAMIPISEGISGLIPMPQWIADYFSKMVQLNLPGYLTLAIAAPIIEELIFRGVILKGFLRKYDPKKAILFSALIFGIVHMNPWQFIPAVIVGTVIGWIYYNTKSVIPGIFIHWINNSTAFVLAIKFKDVNFGFSELIGGWINYVGLLLLCLLIIYFSIKAINNHFQKQTIE